MVANPRRSFYLLLVLVISPAHVQVNAAFCSSQPDPGERVNAAPFYTEEPIFVRRFDTIICIYLL
jgi:hypothetical protein